MEAHYANIVAYRVTPNELVLDFGDFFAGQDKDRKQPDYTDFKTRVVLPGDMIEIMIQALNLAKDARDQSRKTLDKQEAFSLTSSTESSEQKRA